MSRIIRAAIFQIELWLLIRVEKWITLRMFECMLQARESSWGFPSNLWAILNLLLVNVKRFSTEQIKPK